MEHQIKALAEATTNGHTKGLIEAHVNRLEFNEQEKHLVIIADNAGAVHELSNKEGDHHLQNAMEKVYGDITYEVKLASGEQHERENMIPHNINQ